VVYKQIRGQISSGYGILCSVFTTKVEHYVGYCPCTWYIL